MKKLPLPQTPAADPADPADSSTTLARLLREAVLIAVQGGRLALPPDGQQWGTPE